MPELAKPTTARPPPPKPQTAPINRPPGDPNTASSAIGPGHNRPPAEIELDPELLRSRLAREFGEDLARFAELELAIAQIPKVIETEGEAQRVINFVAEQCRPLTTDFKAAHDRIKKPYLESGKVVDAFFLRRLEAFGRLLGPVQKRVDAFRQKKAAEQRRREEELRRAAAKREQERRDEAIRLAKAAADAEAAGKRKEAIPLAAAATAASEAAEAAHAQAVAPPAPVRIHGDYGATAYAKSNWVFEIIDPGEIPLGYLTIDKAAVDAAIAEGVREIPGLRIFQIEQTIIKKC